MKPCYYTHVDTPVGRLFFSGREDGLREIRYLKEKMPSIVLLAIGIGFVGVGFIVKPTSGVFDPITLVGLSAGILGALAQVTIRRLTRTESTTRIVFFFACGVDSKCESFTGETLYGISSCSSPS